MELDPQFLQDTSDTSDVSDMSIDESETDITDIPADLGEYDQMAISNYIVDETSEVIRQDFQHLETPRDILDHVRFLESRDISNHSYLENEIYQRVLEHFRKISQLGNLIIQSYITNEDCGVCGGVVNNEDFYMIPCNHKIHAICMFNLMEFTTDCPICDRDIFL